jgi:hypothetical protein
LCLAESLHGVPAGGVRYIDWLADLDVVAASSLLVSIALPISVPHVLPIRTMICTRRWWTYVSEMSLISTSS